MQPDNRMSETETDLDVALLPKRLRELLANCPKAGGGVHNWLIRVAVRLHRFFDDKGDIARIMRRYSSECGRDVEREIWTAIVDGERWLTSQQGVPDGGTAPKARAWPERDEQLCAAVVQTGFSLNQLMAKSPVDVQERSLRAEEVLEKLFPDDPLICVGWDQRRFRTDRLTQCRPLLSRMQFIVPSPMSALLGERKSGGLSAHTLANTGPRSFLVIEFDGSPIDEQAAILWHLAQNERLVLVVHSGGKSIHGWFNVKGKDEDLLKNNFMDYAVRLGADPQTWKRCQFVRMPGGMRDSGKRQEVLYFNPTELEAR